MILINNEHFNTYSRNLIGEKSSLFLKIRNEIGNGNFEKLFMDNNGEYHSDQIIGVPMVFPCLIHTIIALATINRHGSRDKMFYASYTHVVITKSHSKILVYPKTRQHRYNGIESVKSEKDLHIVMARYRDRNTNESEIQFMLENKLVIFPLLFASRAYNDDVILNRGSGTFGLSILKHKFMLFDANSARQLVYFNKNSKGEPHRNVKHGNVKHGKKPIKAVFTKSIDIGELRTMRGRNLWLR